MRHILSSAILSSFVLALLFSTSLFAQDAAEPAEALSPAEAARQRHEQQLAEAKVEAQKAYDELITSYLASDWEAVNLMTRTIRQHQRYLEQDQRLNLAYIQRTYQDFQPKWWDKCSSSSNISFQAEIWNRKLMANYMPSQALGAQGVMLEGQRGYDRRGNYREEFTKLHVLVTWKPGMVNSQTPGTGKLAEIHDMKLGDLGEVIVWHELGHGYISNNLPINHVIQLYNDHQMLYQHLQEFYADLTAIYHSSPKARRFALILRLDGLDRYDDAEQHDRAAHAIGSLLLMHILEDPGAWPSMHFPPAVPEQQVELNTIIYLYEHMDPDWTLDEARALRELAKDFISKNGEKTFRAKGVAPLPNGMSFSLMAGQDHEFQVKRDNYIAEKLKALIESGRADKLEEGEEYDPPLRRPLRDGEEYHRDPEALRIDIPF